MTTSNIVKIMYRKKYTPFNKFMYKYDGQIIENRFIKVTWKNSWSLTINYKKEFSEYLKQFDNPVNVFLSHVPFFNDKLIKKYPEYIKITVANICNNTYGLSLTTAVAITDYDAQFPLTYIIHNLYCDVDGGIITSHYISSKSKNNWITILHNKHNKNYDKLM